MQIAGARFTAVGHLRGYKLTFVGRSQNWKGAVANIQRQRGGEGVWGVVWRVGVWRYAAKLDRQESTYHRLEGGFWVALGGKLRVAVKIHFQSPFE